MAGEKSYLFVSYAREDLDRVRPVIDATRRELAALPLPVELWVDLASLKPGEVWDVAITDALRASVGLLFFVSRVPPFLALRMGATATLDIGCSFRQAHHPRASRLAPRIAA